MLRVQQVDGPRPLLVHHVARMCNRSCRTIRWAAQRGRLRGFHDPATPKLWLFWPEDVAVYREGGAA